MSFFTERSSHPSQNQILVLLEFLERNPSIAKGFPKLPSARAAARKHWEKISIRLNSIGGSLKSWKQWSKYWADKKNTVKKKASLRAAAHRRGDVEMTVELSEIEERILSMMVGVCNVGERHLRIQQLDDTSSSGALTGANGGGRVKVQQSEEHLQKNEIFDPLDVSTSSDDNQSTCVAGTSYVSNDVFVAQSSPIADGMAASPSPIQHMNEMSREPTPIKTEQSPMRHTVPRRLRPRPRLLRLASSPPTQWQTQFACLTDRSLRIEEQRLALDRRHTDILESVSGLMGQIIKRDIERERMVAEALSSVGDGLKLLANALKK